MSDAIRTALDTITPKGWDPQAVYVMLVCAFLLLCLIIRSLRRL